ncbi:MAG TPA: flagellar motor protein MotB [bacterium]|nr:flagellar motor protein MotB [bacterium]HPJ71444.1 flagellar motor protein MotB [bacterium]HPQ66739.1 flagellar motor protein MotB [bacterium]
MPRKKKAGDPLVERTRIEPDVQEGGLEGEWPPKWMTTYSDMTTILLTFFVLWYANTMMGLPQEWIEIAKESSSKIVRGIAEEQTDIKKGDQPRQVMVKKRVADLARNISPQQELAVDELRPIQEKAEEIKETLAQTGVARDIEIKVTAEDVVLIPTTTDILFREGSDTLQPAFYPILDKIAALLRGTGAAIRIEGHTDSVPIHPCHRRRFPSNWELSSARAVAAGRYLIEHGGIPASLISVSGYGDSLPRFPNDTPEHRARNRRIEFHMYISSEMLDKG